MAYTTIKKPSDYFETTTYTGGATDVSSLSFQPDLVWAKKRDGAEAHGLFDSVRGALKALKPNADNAEATRSGSLTSFDSDGWSMGGSDGIISSSGYNYVGWSWKAGTTGSGTTNANKSYNYSVNTTSGFSIIKYTGSGASGHEIPHGLSATPKFIITKRLESTQDWIVYSAAIPGNYVKLNSTTAAFSYTYITSTDNTEYTIGVGGADINNADETYIAYCFAEKQGYSKFGSYTGNGSTDGTFVYTGFKPAFVICKRTNSTGNWIMFDSKRDGFNSQNDNLYTNTTTAEQSDGALDIFSNGFKCTVTGTDVNGSGSSYIYMAFAEQPLVGDNPATAR